MRNNRNRVLGAILIATALVAAACGSGEDTKEGPTITIGSANFPESALLGEIYAQALEADGYPVERSFNIGNREVYAPALESGQLDLVPEYVGSALLFLGGDATADTARSTEALRTAWAEKGIAVLEPAAAQDKNGLAVRQTTADELGLSTTSDLAAYTDLVLGGPPECPERPLCLLGFTDVYGISFAEFKSLDTGVLTVAALEGGEIDVAVLFTSGSAIVAKGFVLLEDDKGLQPAENVIPAIRQEIIDAYGEDVTNPLNAVSAALTTVELSEMNKRLDVDGEDPDQVAADWIDENL